MSTKTRTARQQAVLVMRIGVAWSAAVCVVNLWFHRYWAGGIQAVVGALSYVGVKHVLYLTQRGEEDWKKRPRCILRDDGRVCISNSVRPWYKPVETLCGEMAKPREQTDATVTCLACIADHGPK